MERLCTTDKGLLQIALAGAGVVLLADLMIEPHFGDGRLVRLGRALEAHDLELSLTTRKSQRQNAVLRIETLLSEGAKPLNPRGA